MRSSAAAPQRLRGVETGRRVVDENIADSRSGLFASPCRAGSRLRGAVLDVSRDLGGPGEALRLHGLGGDADQRHQPKDIDVLGTLQRSIRGRGRIPVSRARSRRCSTSSTLAACCTARLPVRRPCRHRGQRPRARNHQAAQAPRASIASSAATPSGSSTAGQGRHQAITRSIMTGTTLSVDAAGRRVSGITAELDVGRAPDRRAATAGRLHEQVLRVGHSPARASRENGIRVIALDRPATAASDALPADEVTFGQSAKVLDAAIAGCGNDYGTHTRAWSSWPLDRWGDLHLHRQPAARLAAARLAVWASTTSPRPRSQRVGRHAGRANRSSSRPSSDACSSTAGLDDRARDRQTSGRVGGHRSRWTNCWRSSVDGRTRHPSWQRSTVPVQYLASSSSAVVHRSRTWCAASPRTSAPLNRCQRVMAGSATTRPSPRQSGVPPPAVAFALDCAQRTARPAGRWPHQQR